MSKAVIFLAVGAAIVCLTLPALVVSAVFSGGGSGCLTSTLAGGGKPLRQWDMEQTAIAKAIFDVWARKDVPHWGLVIAFATAMQESGLRNLPHLGSHDDHDSIGVFQQRPSQGWGTPEQLARPEYQAERFFDKLLDVPHWQQLPLTQAAQAVQVSAYPNAYEKWTQDALQLAAQFSVGGQAPRGDPGMCLSSCPPPATSTPSPAGVPSVTASPPAIDGECTTLVRAASWLTAWNGGPVPYSANTDPSAYFGGYRRDCSGFTSMALGLAGPGLNTAGLAARSRRLEKFDLRAGDLLINPTPGGQGHVVIFDRWTDATMTSYIGYEQAGSGGTYHRRIPWPYYGTYHLDPYRLAN
ncbi:hypothetical protein Rhe02_09800 [Rhizocola hellebori]|uniref:NlpC/P60 domain-containing protein n=1 Tax=Rhizocola hellebori TaxID=1392758 RepID=A0A8J3Q2W1_9ACTN|nr:glycoside hydrolase [Rhizocola hellebori]GIH02913.1 hypothetical protein Rhe02_09800 [Rhizocola hellebori]